MYNATSLSPGPILLPHLMRAILTKRLTFRGFIVSDFFGRYGDFMRDVSAWVGEGRIKYREDVVEGLKNAPRALIGLLRGENFGKLLVRVAANDTRQQH
jgi:NADPH-dependent curcumin reductase CurA